ncbi:MAG: acetolactate synthase large subunit, partial [Gaiellales bacterium]|nr:acetolactate synthase large subunit [Gaiellales bacterium]
MPTAFEALADGLAGAGVERVFGLMGDDTVRLVAALVARGMPYADTRHENAAVAMATGYAGAADRLGVCIISRGPGTTNGLTAAINASRGDASVLIISGDEAEAAPTNTAKLPDHKALDAAAVAAICGIAVYTPRSADSIITNLRDAIHCASDGQTVLLTLPRDLLEMEVGDCTPLEPVAAVQVRAPAADSSIAAAVAVLETSRRPLIVAGAGAWSSGARDVLVLLAERVGGALATTLRGKDMFAGHPYDLGMVGSFSHSAGRRMIDEADCVIVFGASLNRWTTNGGTSLPEVPLIHVDAERSHIARYHRADISITGDARLVAEQLLEALPERDDSDKPWYRAATRERLADFDLAEDFESAA